MGHKRLGYLPKTKAWREIVKLIGDYAAGSAEITSIANKTLQKVQARFDNLGSDPSVQAAFEFLVKFSFAFQKENPTKYLTESKILDKEELTIIKIARAAAVYKNSDIKSHEYQAFATQSAIDAITIWYKNNIDKGSGLFNEDIDKVAVFRKTGHGDGFSEISRMYFSRLTERYLKYFLDREASIQITNLDERKRFSSEITNYISAISKHAFETSKITQSYSAGWFNKYSKNNEPQNKEIKRFLSYAFSKMKSEMLREEMK